jgi:VWFA-related protein
LLVLSLTWVALGAHGLSGQQGQPTPPVFRANVDAVELDVFVTDQQGRPVTDLTAGDFQLDEDGVAQTVTSFSLVNVPMKSAAAPVASIGAEPDVQSNLKPDGRLYVFVMDGLGGEYALRTRLFLRRFLEEHFTENDTAALVYLGPSQARNTQDFTGNTRLLLRSINNIMGGSSTTPVPAESSLGSSTLVPAATTNFLGGSRVTMESLRALTESLAQIRGRRKVMLYFTHGLGMDVFDTLDHAGGTRSIAFDDFHAAMSAATRGNIAIYPIDPAGLTLQGSLSEAIDLRALAYATGGDAIVNTNSIASGLARIVRENSTYYVLGFASTSDRREGRFRKVQVRVSRPGLVVRTRTGYLEPQRHAPKQAVTTIATLPSGLAKALEQPLANRAVPMTVFAAPYRSGDRQATIVIAQEMETAALGLTQGEDSLAGEIATAAVAVRFDGKIYGGKHQTRAVTVPRDGANGGTVRIVSQIQVPPGRYQLRVAGGTANRAGSVMYDVDVPDYKKEPLTMSGVALTLASAGAVLVDLSEYARTRLPASVTTSREFGSGEDLTVYAEVYENARNAAAHNVDVKVELRTADGRVVRTLSQQRASTEVADGKNGFTLTVPLNGAAGGDHVLRVEARSSLDDETVVSSIPIRIR